MGAGFYLIFATSILMHHIAEADRKPGWIWFGVNLCVSFLMGKLFALSVTMALVSFFITFALMFIINVLTPDEPN